ncbi:hypothetical protein ABPG72_001352 [Tetrahymena utriculariae]
MDPSQCCSAAEISVYGGEDPSSLKGDHLVLSLEEQLIYSWLDEKGINMANPVDNIYSYFESKRQSVLSAQSLSKKPSSLLSRRKNQLKTSPLMNNDSSPFIKFSLDSCKDKNNELSQIPDRFSFSSLQSFDSSSNSLN